MSLHGFGTRWPLAGWSSHPSPPRLACLIDSHKSHAVFNTTSPLFLNYPFCSERKAAYVVMTAWCREINAVFFFVCFEFYFIFFNFYFRLFNLQSTTTGQAYGSRCRQHVSRYVCLFVFCDAFFCVCQVWFMCSFVCMNYVCLCVLSCLIAHGVPSLQLAAGQPKSFILNASWMARLSSVHVIAWK